MPNDSTKTSSPAAFDRPLLLTAGQDIKGYLFQSVGKAALWLITAVSVVAVLLIFYFILGEAAPFVRRHGLVEFFTSASWHPERARPEFGILSMIVGSLYVTAGAMAIAVPLGMLAAVMLSDILPYSIREVVKPIIEILAAIPSVAYGFFAVLVAAPWMQRHLGISSGANALNASVILAVMALPTIVSVSEDALSAVGRDMREGAYALGSTRAEAVFQVVIPAAHTGIVAGVILGTMRAVGETMVVWMAAGNSAKIPSPWWDLTQPVRTMTATIAAETAEVPKGSDHYFCLFAVGATLLVMTFLLNLASEHYLALARRGQGGRK